MTASNIVGVDPHRRTFTATVLDSRGGELGHAHFPNTRQGHDAGLAWAAGLGPADRWGVEGASGLGRHLAEFLVAAGCDVRDVPPHNGPRSPAQVHKWRMDGAAPPPTGAQVSACRRGFATVRASGVEGQLLALCDFSSETNPWNLARDPALGGQLADRHRAPEGGRKPPGLSWSERGGSPDTQA